MILILLGRKWKFVSPHQLNTIIGWVLAESKRNTEQIVEESSYECQLPLVTETRTRIVMAISSLFGYVCVLYKASCYL